MKHLVSMFVSDISTKKDFLSVVKSWSCSYSELCSFAILRVYLACCHKLDDSIKGVAVLYLSQGMRCHESPLVYALDFSAGAFVEPLPYNSPSSLSVLFDLLKEERGVLMNTSNPVDHFGDARCVTSNCTYVYYSSPQLPICFAHVEVPFYC